MDRPTRFRPYRGGSFSETRIGTFSRSIRTSPRGNCSEPLLLQPQPNHVEEGRAGCSRSYFTRRDARSRSERARHPERRSEWTNSGVGGYPDASWDFPGEVQPLLRKGSYGHDANNPCRELTSE